MYYKLKTFAKGELKEYGVIRHSGYDIDNPTGRDGEFKFPMIIYKKSLKVLNPTQDGVRESMQVAGKVEKIYDLRNGDVILYHNQKMKVIDLFPREYADFSEFVLEVV